MKAKIVPRRKISAWKILVSGAIFAAVAQAIHTAGAYLSMNYYINPAYSGVWSRLMMSIEPGSFFNSFTYLSMAAAFITGIIFAFAYALFRASVPGKDVISRGLSYGFIVLLISAIPGYLSLYLLVNMPAMLIFYWAAESAAIYLISGLAVAKVND